MVGKAVYSTPFGIAEQTGMNQFTIISGTNIGYVLNRKIFKGAMGNIYNYELIGCPQGSELLSQGALGKVCVKKNISVKQIDGTKYVSKNGNSDTYIDSNGKLKTETNWLLYGAIALGAFILFER